MEFRFSSAEEAFIAQAQKFIEGEREQAEREGVFAPNREADSMLSDSSERTMEG